MSKHDWLSRLASTRWFVRWTSYVVIAILLLVAIQDVVAEVPKTDDAMQVRVRELIYVLRQYRPSARGDEWGSAIRELANIGKPALPELLRELKNTEREPTFQAMLFTLRAIGDPRALPFVIDELPRAERQSNRFTFNYSEFTDSKVNQFMQQNQYRPDDRNDFVSYGGPINEILGTLHKLSGTKDGDSWNAADWRNWWTLQQSSGKAEKRDTSLILAPRNEDLVERDGLYRYGVLFRTGPGQFLSPVMEIQFQNQSLANVPWALDMETGRIYEPLEGIQHAPKEKFEPFDVKKWLDRNRIDICGGDVRGVHLWLIDNARWESLDSEVASGRPLNMGREAFDISERDNNAPGKGVGTFLFTTREGSRGVMRVQHFEDAKATKYEYRLWNRREPIELREWPHASEGKPGTWQPAKLVLLKEPEFDNECLFDFKQGKKVVLPRSVFDQKLPDLEKIRKMRGALFNDWRIAPWAEQQGIDLVTAQRTAIFKGNSVPPRKICYLLVRAARESRVNEEAFETLSVARAKEILDRKPDLFQITQLGGSSNSDELARPWVFNTKAGVVGLLRILQENGSSIGFEYKLADEEQE
jgi:hypothetical protein